MNTDISVNLSIPAARRGSSTSILHDSREALRCPLFPTSTLPFFPCRCKFGVNITGTKTSDVICNGMKHTGANASPTPGRAVSTGQPRVRVQIQKLLTTAAAATTTTPRRIPHSDTTSPSGTADPVGKPCRPRPHAHKTPKMRTK